MKIATTPLLLASLLAAAPELSAQDLTLTSNEVLRIHFTMNPPLNGTPDVLKLNFGLITVNAPFTTRTATLYDCDRLLGTAASSSFGSHSGLLNLDPTNSWKEASSVWNFDSPGIASDFSTIQNGTIVGIIDYEIATGSITVPAAQINLSMIRATSTNGGFVVGPPPTVLEAVVVPKHTGPVPGTAGVANTWTISGATPSSIAWFGFGITCKPFTVPVGTPFLFDLADAFVFLPVPVDASGTAMLTFTVPPHATGATVLTQGLEMVGLDLRATQFRKHTF